MTTTPKEAVEPFQLIQDGKARINVATVIHDGPEVFVAEIDMHSKYVEPVIASTDKRPPELILMSNERALQLNDCLNETILCLPDHTAGWHTIVEGGRYTIRVVAWNPEPSVNHERYES